MSVTTAIAWTDHTFNPWWGCEKISPGCDHCYAESFAKRTGHQVWGHDSPFRFFGDKHWDEPLRWTGGRVFCASMADVFQPSPLLTEHRARLWQLIDDTQHLTWQLLTKRPEQVLRHVPDRWLADWPGHVWLGVTIEDQEHAALRIPRLLAIRGVPVRFLSVEPMLGWVNLETAIDPLDIGARWTPADIGWVICGGESGPRHRPLDLDHARSLRDQCRRWGIPFFFKQVGGRTPTAGGDLLNGVTHKDFPA